MATVHSLQARHDGIVALYNDNEAIVRSIQQEALTDLLPLLEQELALDEAGILQAKSFILDRVTVFRFCRRARFSIPAALNLLHATLTYRLSHPPLSVKSASLPALYLSEPLFFFHPSLIDKCGRPCGVLNLRLVSRTEDGELDGLKEFVRLGWEVGRRWLTELSKQKEGGVKVQMVLIVDLDGAGMSNLEVELLPFFMDLLKSHFPGMVGAIFVLNYGWMYAGMWQLAKRVLPNTALERILFPTKAELLQFFTEDHLLIEHGGTLSYSYTPDNPIVAKYGIPPPPVLNHSVPSSPSYFSHPLPTMSPIHTTGPLRPAFHSSPSAFGAAYPSPLPSPGPSRNHSTDSLEDFYHSVPGTPRGPGTLSRRPSGLSMTSLKFGSNGGGGFGSGLGFVPSSLTPTGGLGSSLMDRGRRESDVTITPEGWNPLRRVTSFAELHSRLEETAKLIEESDSEGSEGTGGGGGGEGPWDVYGDYYEGETPMEGEEGEEGAGRRGWRSVGTSQGSSRATSRDVSQSASREVSPQRRRFHTSTSHQSMHSGLEGETFTNRAVRFSGTHPLSPYNTSNPYYGYPAFVPPTSLDPSGVPRPHHHRRRKRDLFRTLTYLAVLRFLEGHRGVKRRLSILAGSVKTTGGKQGVASAEKERKKDKRMVYFYLALVFLILRTRGLGLGRVLDAVGGLVGSVMKQETRGVKDVRRKRDVVKSLLGWTGSKALLN